MTTLPNLHVPSTGFIDLYVNSGITVGTELLIQNKGEAAVRVIEDSTLPTVDDNRGVMVDPMDWLKITAGSVGAYAIGYSSNGDIELVVQDNS